MEEDTVTGVYGAADRKFLGAEDLHGDDIEVVISGWRKQTMEQKDWNDPNKKVQKVKVVISLAGMDGEVVLNYTNASAIRAAYGEHFGDWIGKPIILYEGEWQGKPALRVRVPKAVKKIAAKPARESENPADGLDDEIPF